LHVQRHDYARYSKRAGGAAIGDATHEAVWQQVTSIGGENGYYFLDFLWRTRELMDAAVGGGGLTRGRSRPQHVQVGDRIDTWEVIGVDPGRRLALRFGMKAPGAGALEFEVQPVTPQRTRIAATAFWEPRGIAGLAYWYALVPVHRVLFEGLTTEILRRAAAAGR
jgi:uncharacterized protein YndB with AHSA1/START domain